MVQSRATLSVFEWLVDVFLSKDITKFLVSSVKLFQQGYKIYIEVSNVQAESKAFVLRFVKVSKLYVLKKILLLKNAKAMVAQANTSVMTTQAMLRRAKAARDLHDALSIIWGLMGCNNCSQEDFETAMLP